MNFNDIFKTVEKFTIDNSPSILTAMGMTGTLTTAFLTGKATFKAAKLIQDREFYIKTHPTTPAGPSALEVNEKVKLVWKVYVPPTVTGVGTLAAIYGANHINSRRAAAVAAAYTLSEKAFEEYREKIVEKLGDKKERAARDEIAQEHVNRNPIGKNQVFITGGGEVLCYDKYTGRYFMSSMDTLKKAENEVNFYVLHNDYACLNDFYRYIGLPAVPVGEEVGWTVDLALELTFTTTMSEDNRPCIVIEYHTCGVRRRPENFLRAMNSGHPVN